MSEEFSFKNLRSKFTTQVSISDATTPAPEALTPEPQTQPKFKETKQVSISAAAIPDKKPFNSEEETDGILLDRLYILFESFSQFGLSKMQKTDFYKPAMSSAAFAKFSKDCRVIGKPVPSLIDVDIIFNKVKDKGVRKLDWGAFITAFGLLADLKYKKISDEDERFKNLVIYVLDKQGPLNTGTTTPKSSAIFDKLTDTSLYTGTHKHRFDADGNGLGVRGRDRPSRTNTLEGIVNRSLNGTLKNTHDRARSRSKSRVRNSPAPSPSSSTSSVFDRLTDRSKYTGTQRQKFADQ